MKLMGFNFTKISIEKISNSSENITINTHMNISDIKELKSDILKTNELVLGINFEYNIDYDPSFAKVSFAGNIILGLDKDKGQEILDQWQDKTLNEDFRFAVFTIILKKANIKAIQLEDEMGLPIHMPLPTLKKPTKQ